MMRRRSGGGRRLAQFEDDEDERVVYYDLEADSHSRDLLLSPNAVSAPSQLRPDEGNHIFPRRPQQPLFNLDDSGDEAEQQQGEENPFASLLQPQQLTSAETPTRAEAGESQGHSFLQVEAAASKEGAGRRATGRGNSKGGNPRSILKRSQQSGVRALVSSGKKLGFESADSRPARWSSRKPSATDSNNRRRSLSAIQKRRSQLEVSVTKRRKSLPATISGPRTTQDRSSLDDSVLSSPAAPKRRLLSDVLQRATTLSQQQNVTNDEFSPSQDQIDENPRESDAILDTEHQMRAEPFAPQIFSPTKPTMTSTAAGRKPKVEAGLSKIRGGIGDVVRKAIRKSNRDLTLLRSHGQHLLSEQNSNASSMSTMTAVESIQERACIVICLKQRREVTNHFVTFECRIHEVAAKLENTNAIMLRENSSIVLEALFQPSAVQYLKLSSGQLLKIYEPHHFVAEEAAAGSTSKPKWFLLSTQLAKVVEEKHHCAAGRRSTN